MPLLVRSLGEKLREVAQECDALIAENRQLRNENDAFVRALDAAEQTEQERTALRARVAELEAREACATEYRYDTEENIWNLWHNGEAWFLSANGDVLLEVENPDEAFAKLRDMGLWPPKGGE